MGFRLVADSCCDMTQELRELGLVSVPLKMTVGERTFVDDEKLDVQEFIRSMTAYKGRIISACPSPGEYAEAFAGEDFSFAVTLSSNLSASYSSAMSGKEIAEEKGAQAHIFDSKSASAAEILIVLKIKELIDKGLEKLEIITHVTQFIQTMKTYFVLDNYDNLIRNGRMSKVVGQIASVINIKPILGSDADGNIALYAKIRGFKRSLEKLAEMITESGKKTEGETMVITHCNNPESADYLKKLIEAKHKFKQILVIPTRGLSSMYAGVGGIIMAF